MTAPLTGQPRLAQLAGVDSGGDPGATRVLAGSAAAGLIIGVQAGNSQAPAPAPGRAGSAERPPPDDFEPGEVVPQPVGPRIAPVMRTQPSRRLEAGDLVCPACGEGNIVTRRFCSRCGGSLVTAEVVVPPPPPWWHRFLFWRQKGPKVAPAGTRPGQKGGGGSLLETWRRVRRGFGVGLAGLGMVVLLVPGLRGPVTNKLSHPVDTVKKAINTRLDPVIVPARPASITGSTAVPTHPAALAFDQGSNTYWAAVFHARRQPWVRITFDRPVDLTRLLLTSGAPAAFVANHRPRELRLVYDSRSSETLAITDVPEPQTLVLKNGRGVTSVQILVLDTFPAAKARTVAVAEFEFFAKE